MTLEAGIFDLDGVVTDTAKIHFAAWKQTFDDCLQHYASQDRQSFQAFSEHDYLQYVDGKSRLDGMHSFFQACCIQLSKEMLHSLAEKKQALFLELLGKLSVPLFQSTVDLIQQLHDKKIVTAVVSSSKNCKKILETASISDLFSVRVDGVTLEQLDMLGKPSPDMFVEAARGLSVEPANTFIVEDAIVGVQAGRAGGFGLIIGIDRQGSRRELFLKNGADIVVNDLAELALETIVTQMKVCQS